MIGTRFLISQESSAFKSYQERIFKSKEDDTVITKAFTGRYARCIKNKLTEEFTTHNMNPLSWPLQALAADDIYAAAQSKEQPDYFPLLAGQGLGLINKRGQSASEIIKEIISEANDTVNRLNFAIE
jgi:nitronate monooxygenase